jgi:hypothetical protein
MISSLPVLVCTGNCANGKPYNSWLSAAAQASRLAGRAGQVSSGEHSYVAVDAYVKNLGVARQGLEP